MYEAIKKIVGNDVPILSIGDASYIDVNVQIRGHVYFITLKTTGEELQFPGMEAKYREFKTRSEIFHAMRNQEPVDGFADKVVFTREDGRGRPVTPDSASMFEYLIQKL